MPQCTERKTDRSAQAIRSAKNSLSMSIIWTNRLYVSNVLDVMDQPTCKLMSSSDILRRFKTLTVPLFTPCVCHSGGVLRVKLQRSFKASYPSAEGSKLMLPKSKGEGANCKYYLIKPANQGNFDKYINPIGSPPGPKVLKDDDNT